MAHIPYDRVVVGVGDPQVLNLSSQMVPVDVQGLLVETGVGQGGGVYVVLILMSWHLRVG
jgi:hypothetical protein